LTEDAHGSNLGVEQVGKRNRIIYVCRNYKLLLPKYHIRTYLPEVVWLFLTLLHSCLELKKANQQVL
jgi:hypothetical protein